MAANRFIKSKSGVNPIILAVFLFIILLVAVLAVWLWWTAIERAGQAIQIQGVHFGDSETVIYVQNVGEGIVTIHSVYIDQQEFKVDNTNCEVNDQKTTNVEQGKTAAVTIDRAFEERIHVKVICIDGTMYEADYKKEL